MSGPQRGSPDGSDRLHRLLLDGLPVAEVEIARAARQRSRGLLGRDGVDGAIWLEPAKQVHTAGMRFAIDVAFLDRDGVVLRTTTMRPWRLSRLVVRARAVVEAEAGALAGWGVRAGRVLTHEEAA